MIGFLKFTKKEWNQFKDFFNILDNGAKITTYDLLRNTNLNINQIRGIILEGISRKYLKVEPREKKPDIIVKLKDMEEF